MIMFVKQAYHHKRHSLYSQITPGESKLSARNNARIQQIVTNIDYITAIRNS